MKKVLTSFMKSGIVLGLFWYMFSKGMMSLENLKEGFSNYPYSFIAIFLLFLCSVVGVIRWYILLRDQGMKVSFYNIFELSFVGNFFNTLLPGAVAGEFVKTYYLSKSADQAKKSVTTILLDRFIGLSCLVLGSFVALIFSYNEMKHIGITQAIKHPLMIFGMIFTVLYVYLFFLPTKNDFLYKALLWLDTKVSKYTSFFKSAAEVYFDVKSYQNKKQIVVTIIALSLLMQSLAVASYVFFSYALGDFNIIIPGFFVTVPLVLLICSIPVAPAGLGTGNLAFFYFAQFLGTQKGADIFSLAAVSVMLVNCIGLLFYIKFQIQHWLKKSS